MRAPRPLALSRGAVCVSVLAIGLMATAAVSAALDVPSQGGHINDLAHMLSPTAQDRLEGKLSDLERRTGAHVAVLTIPSLEGESIEAYAVRVAQTWKLGREDVDDDVLFLVAKQDRKMRIEGGYGLGPGLAKVYSRYILDEVVNPRFRRNDFEGGIETGIDAIAAIMSGEPLPASSLAHRQNVLDAVAGLLVEGATTILVGLYVLILVLTPGFIGWFFYFFFTFFALVAIVLRPTYGVVIGCGWIEGFPILRLWLRPSSKDFKNRHPYLAGLVGSVADSDAGGGLSGRGFSGGGGRGFSGGGGGFGGGGASGRW